MYQHANVPYTSTRSHRKDKRIIKIPFYTFNVISEWETWPTLLASSVPYVDTLSHRKDKRTIKIPFYMFHLAGTVRTEKLVVATTNGMFSCLLLRFGQAGDDIRNNLTSSALWNGLQPDTQVIIVSFKSVSIDDSRFQGLDDPRFEVCWLRLIFEGPLLE